jgi:FkbM family methyltransferase
MMNIEMYLDVEDIRSVPFSVIADGKYEPLQSDLILGLAAQSKYFLDIGANVGYYSISAAKINPQLKIKSFEPNPMIVEKFKRNIDLNQLSSQIEIFECGLGSENSDLTQMFIPQFTGSGGGSLKNLHPEEGKPDTLSIKVRILDELLNMDSATVDLMKIDVEGFEKYVLEGGMGTIRNYLPTIVIELLRKWMLPFNTSPQDVLQSLKLFGYRCYAIQKLKLLEIDEIDDMTEATNFIFVHPLREIHSEWLLGKAESSAK